MTRPPNAKAPLFIGGAWRAGSGAPIEVFNPTDGRPIAVIASATDEEVGAALEAARTAQPQWAATPAPARGRRLRELADLIAAHRDRLAELIVDEVGKPRAQALDEVDFAVGLVRYSAEWDRRLEGEILPGDAEGEVVHLLRAPVGVVGAICP